MDTKQIRGIICIFGVNLRLFLLKTYFEGMIYIPTTNVQGFINQTVSIISSHYHQLLTLPLGLMKKKEEDVDNN